MVSFKRIARARWVQRTIGVVAAEYLRMVYWTSRLVTEPRISTNVSFQICRSFSPCGMDSISWRHSSNGRIFPQTLISRHRDGEMNAVAAEWLGVETIRGSGDHGGGFHRKGGVGAYREMLQALADGYSVALTADVPKVSRIAGPGIVRLARDSGRPIYPVALASSRRIEMDNWDRSAVNLPFSRLVGVVGEPIRVPATTDEQTLEAARLAVEASLNAATARAYAIADGNG